MEKIVYKTQINGETWRGKIKAFSQKILERTDGDPWAAVDFLAENIMVRDLILDIQFGVTEEKKFELFKKYTEMIEDVDAKRIVKPLSEYRKKHH